MNTKKYFITLFSFIIFSIYFTLSGVFVPFIASIPQSNGGFKTLSSQNDFYKITLDTYMLIPYPSTLWEVDKTNFQFESLLYFAMINCDLLPFVEESQILKNIKSISDETGFSDFSLVGIDNFQIQHIELLLFIQKHHILFIIGFLIIFILLNILCLYLFNHILKSICNQSTLRKKHNKIFMLNIVIPYGSAFLLGTSLATLFIKKILPISIIIGIITLVLIYLINYLFLSKFLHVSSNLQQ